VNWDRLFTAGATVVSSNLTITNTSLRTGTNLWYSSATMSSPIRIVRPINFAAYPSEFGLTSGPETVDEEEVIEWDGTFV
jgi:hypothetical protein